MTKPRPGGQKGGAPHRGKPSEPAENPRLSPADWQRLRALRDRFLSGARGEYWTPRDLELYDATFAQRIGWKWDAVLETLDRAGWRPKSPRLLDWGCGSGIAGRAVADWTRIREAFVFDRSAAAMTFAGARLRARGLSVATVRPDEIPADTLLLISHVAGELSDEDLLRLARGAAGAAEVLWVEPGSRDISRRLTLAHDELQKQGHHPVAPCTHDRPCPMNSCERDWCHFFAPAPPEIFQSAFWREFSTRLEIDLRALPFSFLATSRHPVRWPAAAERVIGRARAMKAHCELLCCGAGGLVTRDLQKRDAPALFRAFTREEKDGAFVWKPNPSRPERVLEGTEVRLAGSADDGTSAA